MNVIGKYGSWGVLEDMRQETLIDTTTMSNATNFAKHHEPYPDPYLRYLQPNATFSYPLKILHSFDHTTVTVYVVGNSGVLEGAIKNEQFLHIQTPKTADWDIFEAAPVMQFNTSHIAVPCVITFRLRVIENGYNIRSFNVGTSTDQCFHTHSPAVFRRT